MAAYELWSRDACRRFPNQLSTGEEYRTIASGTIAAFGGNVPFRACRTTPDGTLGDSFFERALFHMTAWPPTSAPVILQHNDFVWSSGPFMNPKMYRQILISYYAELWKFLHAAGKKVLLRSEGNFMTFAEDIVQAGGGGRIFEPCNDFRFTVDRFGRSVCLAENNVDSRDLTLGHAEKVRDDIQRTFEALTHCSGVIVAVGNHLSPKISPDMRALYFHELLLRLEAGGVVGDVPRIPGVSGLSGKEGKP